MCTETFSEYISSLCFNSANIEEHTRGQRHNIVWKKARVNRITASKFGSVIARKEKTPPDNLVKFFAGYSKDPYSNSLEWGKKNEKKALVCYLQFCNKNEHNISITGCGLIVSVDYPFLAASPDSLVHCEHCKETSGIVEVKCPFKYRHLTPIEAAQKSDFYCSVRNGKMKLNLNHSYYYQVQGQLVLTNRKWCDFVVWTPKGIHVERIWIDNKLWEERMLPKLKAFYMTSILPEMFSSRIKRGLQLYPEN
ncbi:hypothetical protein ACJMK2_026409 [Sinanodonta woodiana]|uniref:YqaJ viral recombinase domain-containing protein n=1 Tax=Sinanodonta woodiana TaxID=1069815 RepID=A0ABD3XLD1_SINWO